MVMARGLKTNVTILLLTISFLAMLQQVRVVTCLVYLSGCLFSQPVGLAPIGDIIGCITERMYTD